MATLHRILRSLDILFCYSEWVYLDSTGLHLLCIQDPNGRFAQCDV